MDINNQLIYNNAQRLGLKVEYLPTLDFLDIQLGAKHYYFFGCITPFNQGGSIFINKNKFNTKQLLSHAGFPVAKAILIHKHNYSISSLPKMIQTLRFPLVAKPAENTSKGANVLCNIKDLDMLDKHIQHIFKQHHQVLIEEFHEGLREYRVLVLKNRVIGVLERVSASLTGDGKHTIEELIIIKNKERERLSTHFTLKPIELDLEAQQCLEEQGLSLKSVIPKTKKIKLCHTVNTSRGGDIVSMGTSIHPINAKYLCAALRETGFFIGGFDMLCEDINQPFKEGKWLIIEINHNPDISIHEGVQNGIQIKVAKKILWQLIRQHPLSYLYQICKHPSLSTWIKAGCCTLFLLSCILLLKH